MHMRRLIQRILLSFLGAVDGADEKKLSGFNDTLIGELT
jgi:hypothetical protein